MRIKNNNKSMFIRILKLIWVCGFLLVGSVVFSQELKKIKVTELDASIKESKGPLIINFWATYCKPCIEEIPYFQVLSEKYGVALLLVSLDLDDYYPDKIRTFAVTNKFTAPMVWLDEYDADYFCPLVDSTWSGAIPASIFINNDTGYRRFVEDQLTVKQLEKIILSMRLKPE
jgi:thiol-disulfide isomerase/thioredoxin